MFMYLQKNKKGFTLIELMVVVAIIGILALLGLRLYTQQQEKSKDAIVKANAGTVHTLIQSELADGAISDVLDEIDCSANSCAGMSNPYENDIVATQVPNADEDIPGVVVITESGPNNGTYFLIDAYGGDGTAVYDSPQLVAQR